MGVAERYKELQKNNTTKSTGTTTRKGVAQRYNEHLAEVKKQQANANAPAVAARVSELSGLSDTYSKMVKEYKKTGQISNEDKNTLLNTANYIKSYANETKEMFDTYGYNSSEVSKAIKDALGHTLAAEQMASFISEPVPEESEESTKPSKNYLGALGEAFTSGMFGAIVNNTNAFLDMIIGEPLRQSEKMGITNPNYSSKGGTLITKDGAKDIPTVGEAVGNLYDWSQSEMDDMQALNEANMVEYDHWLQKLGIQGTEAIGSAIPQAIIAMATGGASASAGAAAKTGAEAILKNPSYWYSTINAAGNTYDSARDEGASYEEALLASLLNAPVSGLVETGSGIETMPANSGIKEILKSAAGEGTEEVLQSMFENTTKKAVYDDDRKVFSVSDDNAIINPLRSVQEFGLGALAGGVLSGANAGIQSTLNAYNTAVNNSNTGRYIIENYGNEGVEEIIRQSQLFDSDTEVYKLGQKLSEQVAKGDINETLLGKVSSAIEVEFRNAALVNTENALTDSGMSESDIRKYMDIAVKTISGQNLSNEEVNLVRGNNTVSQIFTENLGSTTGYIAEQSSYSNEYGVRETSSAAQGETLKETTTNLPTVSKTAVNEANTEPDINTYDAVLKSTEEDVSIKRFDTTGDDIKLVLNDNSVVAAKELILSDDVKKIIAFARNYPVETANTMLHAYKAYSTASDSGTALLFARSFNQMYKYGKTGSMTFDEAMEYMIKDIPQTIYELAYNRGQQDHKADVEEKQKIADSKKTGEIRQGSVDSISESDAKKYKVSTVDMDVLSDRQKDAADVMEVISKALGINTYFFSDEGAGKIHGIYKDGNIYLNINAGHYHEQAILRTAAHELTHHIQSVSPKLYDDLKTYIISKYHENDTTSFDALVKDKMDSLNLTEEKAIDEVIADSCEMMLQDGSAVTELVNSNKSLWEHIKAVITTIVEKLKNAFKGISESSPAAIELKNAISDWTEIQKMWNEALVASEQRLSNGFEKIQFSEESDYNKAVNPKLLDYINDVIDGIWNRPMDLIEVNTRAAAKIKELFGKDSEGYIYVINQDSVKHIIERHGKNGKTDTSMEDNNDVARMEYAIENFDDIYILMRDGKQLYSSAYKNGDNTMAPKALITKKIGEEYYYVTVALSSSNSHRYGIVSVYKNKKEPLQVLADMNTRSLTPKALLTSSSFNSNITDTQENVNTENDDGDFSRDVATLSPRYILASTLMDATVNAEEKEHLKKYQEAIASIEDKETRINITKNAIRTAIFERESGLTVSMESINNMKKAVKNLERSVDYWDKKLLELEATAPLKNLMERQRKKLSQKYMEEARTRLNDSRDRFYASNRREQIKKNANTLISWIERPTNNNYIPDVLKKPVIEFLTSIDFVSSKASPTSNTTKEWVDKMLNLRHMITDIELDSFDENEIKAQAFVGAIDPELKSNITDFIRNNKGTKLSDLSPTEVENLHRIIVALKSAVTNANKFYQNQMSASVEQIGNRTLTDLGHLKDKTNYKMLKVADELLNVDMLDARSYFSSMGEAGLSIYNELREGFNKRVFSLSEADKYMQENLLPGKTDKEKKRILSEWTGRKAKVHEFKVTDAFGNDKTVKITTGQLMNLYCLSKREQALNHITVGGIRIRPALNSKVQGNVVGIHLNKITLNSWLENLTTEEKQAADMMQNYLSSTVSGWGNEVSQAMYGYDKFTEKSYWPIETDNNTHASNDKNAGNTSLYQIKNMGMTKPLTAKANNPIMIGDIFDVFTKHVTDMANYRGYVIPLLDAMKWYNFGDMYQIQSGEDSQGEFVSVKQQIERVYGTKAKQYFIKLMQDINGSDASDKSITEKLVSGYKSAAVGGNLRVTLQQPMAYMRAAAVIDPKYLVKALGQKPAVAEMQKYSAIAIWKSYGYYDTGIGQSLKKIITGIDGTLENIKDKSMWLAGKADDITWGTIWNACKEEVKDTNPESVGTDAFMKLVTKRFDEVIDRTQVVDTVLHRTQIMRSKNAYNQMATSFMSEPMKSFNMLRNAIVEMIHNKDSASMRKLTRTVSAWLVSSFCTAASAAVVDMLRNAGKDDDKDKNAWERYLDALKENTIDNVNPLNMIPFLKEIPSMIDGYTPSRMDMEGISSLVNLGKTLSKLLKGDTGNKNAYYYIRLFAKTCSQLTGVPAYNIMRDLEGIWNSVKGTPKITTTKDTVTISSISQSAADAYLNGEDAADELKRLEYEIAREYPAYTSEKVHEVAVSKIKSNITSEYKENYIKGSSADKQDIISSMYSTGLYDNYEDVKSTCRSWEVSYWKDMYIKASSGADRAEYRRKLYATGKWKTLSDLDKDIKKWISVE